MRAGDLRHTVIIQQETEVADGMGGVTATWGTVTGMGAVPAAIWPLSASEFVEAKQVQAEVSHRIRIRYRSGVTHKMRILHGSRIFKIKGIINHNERNVYLDMMCQEEVS